MVELQKSNCLNWTSPEKEKKEELNEAVLQEIEDLKAAALKNGYNQGHMLGVEQGVKSYNEKKAEVQDLLSSFAHSVEDVNEKLDSLITPLIYSLTKAFCRYEISVNPSTIQKIIAEALNALPEDALQVRILLNPADVEHCTVPEPVKIVASEKISQGGCLIDCDIAQIDALVESRLDCLQTAHLS